MFDENFHKNFNLDDSGFSLPVFPSKTNLKLQNIPVTPKMVRKVIIKLNLSKVSGPKELSGGSKELRVWTFLHTSWLVCVFKNVRERSTAKNYCPVSLLSVVCKVFEKLVNNRIVDHLEKCGLFSDFQYGFRSSRSTADLLTVVSDRIARAFNRSGATRAVALDIS